MKPRPASPAACRLDGGVQRQHVGLLGNVRDQFHDLADLLRRLAQSLDPLRSFLDLFADLVHAGDLVVHRALAAFGRFQRVARHLGRLTGAARHLVDLRGHLQHLLAGVLDLA
ncbi:MAG: hypothetical protein U5L03_17240 [Burkholderiaceae bacterium]|nr:hypothetical protein [Burkholderiaceae bacterium]